MDRRNPFHRQAELVVRVLPYVARRDEFALKGGTAINLFLRHLPRLSVDVDLACLPHSPRQQALPAIRRGLDTIANDLMSLYPGSCARPGPFQLSASHDRTGSRRTLQTQPIPSRRSQPRSAPHWRASPSPAAVSDTHIKRRATLLGGPVTVLRAPFFVSGKPCREPGLAQTSSHSAPVLEDRLGSRTTLTGQKPDENEDICLT